MIDEAAVAQYITKAFSDVATTTEYGYTFFFYGSDRMLPFATMISADQDYDRVSNLDRPGVFRLNIGVSRQTFEALFGPRPLDHGVFDFAAINVLMPHPEYSAQHFLCVLNPDEETFDRVKLLLAEAYDLAAKRHARRARPDA